MDDIGVNFLPMMSSMINANVLINIRIDVHKVVGWDVYMNETDF